MTEKLEIVEAIYTAFGERRFPAELFSEDFSWETNPDMPDAATYRGRDTVRAYFADWVGGWESAETTIERLIEDGDERVIALVHGRWVLSAGSKPFEHRYAHIWEIRDGIAISARATTGRTPEAIGIDLEEDD